MRSFLDTLGGLRHLLALAVKSGFRMRSPYWRWRAETAFGTDRRAAPGPWQRARAIMAYGRWAYRMKRGR